MDAKDDRWTHSDYHTRYLYGFLRRESPEWFAPGRIESGRMFERKVVVDDVTHTVWIRVLLNPGACG